MALLADEKQAELLENDKDGGPHEEVYGNSTVSDPAPTYQQDPPALSASEGDDPKTDEKQEQQLVKGLPPAFIEAYKLSSERMLCAFGPLISFFFFYGGDEQHDWSYEYLDSESPQIVSGKVVESWQISQPYEVALSPHGAGYFAYLSLSNGLAWRYIGIPLSNRPKKRKARKQFDVAVDAYTKLKGWLQEHVITADDIRSTKVAFGPAARYMAWKPDGTWISNDLPAGLATELQVRKAAAGKDFLPRLVTFGIKNAWAAVWKDGSHTMDLDGKFKELNQDLEERPGGHISFIALDCCGTNEEYFVGFTSIEQRYMMTARRRGTVKIAWDTLVRNWSVKFDVTLSLTSREGTDQSRTILEPKNAAAAQASGAKVTEQIKESERLANEAALLSIESSKKSMKSSQVAIAGGIVAIAAGCTVM